MRVFRSSTPSARRSSVVALLLYGLLSVAPLSVHGATSPTTARTVGGTSATRKPSPALSSLPAPAAAGSLRILLVDDDISDNNHIPGDSRESFSDRVYRELVTEAVGGERSSWSVEHVRAGADGPDVERLQPFNLVIWYTGSSYGGNPDNTSVLSLRDEKTVRQYLQQTGGTVVLISPGYVNKVLDTSATWEESSWPFLSEVIGVRGGKGLAQRFTAGNALGDSGTSYPVTAGTGATETQFSIVNPDGAAVVFRTQLAATKSGSTPVPVATAFPFGKGRMVYLGFTFENIASGELPAAFREVLTATGLVPGATTNRSVAATEPAPPRVAVQDPPTVRRTPPIVAPAPPPAETPPTSTSPGSNNGMTLTSTSEPGLRSVKVRVYSGNDGKESPSTGKISVYQNGGASDPGNPDFDRMNPHHLVSLGMSAGIPSAEFGPNSVLETVHIDGRSPGRFTEVPIGEANRLAQCQQHGLRVEIEYEPNFFLDAWRIQKVELEIDFAVVERWSYTRRLAGTDKRTIETMTKVRSLPGYPKVIPFINGALLNNSNRKLVLITDGFFMPK